MCLCAAQGQRRSDFLLKSWSSFLIIITLLLLPRCQFVFSRRARERVSGGGGSFEGNTSGWACGSTSNHPAIIPDRLNRSLRSVFLSTRRFLFREADVNKCASATGGWMRMCACVLELGCGSEAQSQLGLLSSKSQRQTDSGLQRGRRKSVGEGAELIAQGVYEGESLGLVQKSFASPPVDVARWKGCWVRESRWGGKQGRHMWGVNKVHQQHIRHTDRWSRLRREIQISLLGNSY